MSTPEQHRGDYTGTQLQNMGSPAKDEELHKLIKMNDDDIEDLIATPSNQESSGNESTIN